MHKQNGDQYVLRTVKTIRQRNMKVTVMYSDASFGLLFKDEEEANRQASRDAFDHILLTDVWRRSTTGKRKVTTSTSAPPPTICMLRQRSGAAGGGIISSDGDGYGASEGGSGGGN